MTRSEEEELPDWEEAEEPEIPPALQKKWSDAEKKGLSAGICPSCGNLYREDELSCRHCEAPLDVPPTGAVSKVYDVLFKSPIGYIVVLGITAAVILMLALV